MVERKHFSKTQDFQEAMNKFTHLKDYVNKVSKTQGLPEFKTKLDSSMKTIENPNIIYPVGDPIFIHLCQSSSSDSNIKYNIISPELDAEEKELYDSIVDRIIEIAHTAKVPNSDDELQNIIIDLFNQVIHISHPPEKPNILNNLGKKITITESQYHKISFSLIKDRLGYGVLEPLLRDIYIEDISCIGIGAVWIVHKIFGSIETSIVFSNDIELNKYVVESSERVERPVSEAHPIVDAIMPDGSRVNYIYSKKVSLGGSSFTIRKFNETPISICNLVNWGTWSSELAAYLLLCCENGISIFVCGETASGKTTTLNAMTAFIPWTHKVYSVEQTPEITIPHPIWQHLITRESGEGSLDVTMFDLLIASLRSRPDYIIVGEIRGKEANITFQAMQCIRKGKVFLEDKGFVDIKKLYNNYEKEFGSKYVDEKLKVSIPKDKRENLSVSKKDGKVFSSKMSHIYKMDKKQLFKVVLDNGESLEVTPKHKFIIDKNKEITANKLHDTNLRKNNINSILPDINWTKKNFNSFDMLNEHNILKTNQYLKLEEKFKSTQKYNEIYKNYKDYLSKRSKTVPFVLFKLIHNQFNEKLPKKVNVVFKGIKGNLIVENDISENILNSISNYILNKKVTYKEKLYIEKILKISNESLGNYIFKFSKLQITKIITNLENQIKESSNYISDKLWYSIGRLAGDDSLYITKFKKYKDFRWQIKNTNEDEGKKYANNAKKTIPNNAKSIPTNSNKNTYTTRICNVDRSFIDFLIKNQFISLPSKVNSSKAVHKYIPYENIGNIHAYIAGMFDSDATIRYNNKNRSYDIKYTLNVNHDDSSLMKDQLEFIKKYENSLFPKILCIEFRYNNKYYEKVCEFKKFVEKLGLKVRLKQYDKGNGIGARVEFSSDLKQNVFGIWKKEILPFMYRKDKINTIKSMNVEEKSSKFKNKKIDYKDISKLPQINRNLLPEISLLARISNKNLISDNISYYQNARYYFNESKSSKILSCTKSIKDHTYDITMENGKYYTGGNNNFGYIYDTGHPVISTFHAGSVHSMIQRLTGEPINIPIAFIDNLNVVLIQSAVYVNGKIERRVLSVTEILSYNDEVGKVLTKEIFNWNNKKDKHLFRGLYNSSVLEQRVAHHLGLADPREIYEIMQKRSRIVDAFIKNNIMDYFEVIKILKKFRNDGDRALPFRY